MDGIERLQALLEDMPASIEEANKLYRILSEYKSIYTENKESLRGGGFAMEFGEINSKIEAATSSRKRLSKAYKAESYAAAKRWLTDDIQTAIRYLQNKQGD